MDDEQHTGGKPIFTVRPRTRGDGFEIVVDPPEYGDIRPTHDFATEADAYAWIKDNYQQLAPPWVEKPGPSVSQNASD